MNLFERGTRVRVPAALYPGDAVDTFRTARIEGGRRFGTIEAIVCETCAGGCHVLLVDPRGAPFVMAPELLIRCEGLCDTTDKGDSDGAADGEQHTPVGEGQHVQGVRGPFAGPKGNAALPEPVQAACSLGEGAPQDLTPVMVRLDEVLAMLGRIHDTVEMACAPRTGVGIQSVRCRVLDELHAMTTIEYD